MIEKSKNWDTGYEWKAVTLLTIGFGLVGLDRWIIATAIAGAIAQKYGIQYVPYFALAGLVAGAFVCLFLQETAPRKTPGVVSDLDQLEARGNSAVRS